MKYVYIVISVLAVAFFVLSVQCKEKKNILLMQIMASLCYGFGYFFKAAYSGFITEFVEIAKNLTFYGYEKKKRKIPFMFLILFIAMLLVIAILTFNGWYTIIPLLINLTYFVGTYVKDTKVIRIAVLICGFLWIIYNFLAGTYIFIIGNLFEVISASIALYRFRNKGKKKYAH